MPRRRSTNTADALVTDLKRSIDILITENRSLKRQLQKLTDQGITLSRGRQTNSVGAGLMKMKRQLERVLEPQPATRTRPPANTARTRRPASPETTARRLEALAKARAVRAAKRADAAAT